VRWAASVDGRRLPELREVAEPILREIGDEDTEWRWLPGGVVGQARVEIKQLRPEDVEEWTDGSRSEERAAGSTQTRGLYLGSLATVAAAGVVLAWEDWDKVALDSQGVIQRIWNLQYHAPCPWIGEALKAQMIAWPRVLVWVRGHQGGEGNERADWRAKVEVEMGWRMNRPDIATPPGIRQEYPIPPKVPLHMGWSTRTIKGLVYIVTDKGPQCQWLMGCSSDGMLVGGRWKG